MASAACGHPPAPWGGSLAATTVSSGLPLVAPHPSLLQASGLGSVAAEPGPGSPRRQAWGFLHRAVPCRASWLAVPAARL